MSLTSITRFAFNQWYNGAVNRSVETVLNK